MSNDPAEITNEAIAALRRGGFANALAISERVIALGPAPANAYAVRGLCRYQKAEFHKALKDLQRALEEGADLDPVPMAFADCVARMGGPDAIISQFLQILERQPGHVGLRLVLAHHLRRVDRFEEELNTLVEGLGHHPDDAFLLQATASALLNLHRPEDAIPVAEKLCAVDTQSPEAAHTLGSAHLQLGQMKEAKTAFLDAMKRQPAYPRSFMAFSRMKHDDTPDELMDELLDQARTVVRSAKDADAVHLYFGMGKLNETRGHYREAFRAYQRGGAMRAREVPYDRARTEATFQTIKTYFNADRIRVTEAVGDATSAPIFIVGLPRSGSTFTEQILASHSQVEGLGELSFFPRLGGPLIDGLVAGEQVKIDAKHLAEAYLTKVTNLRSQNVPYFVDKTLVNAQMVGLIHMAFPNATILHVKRYILDTCISCFAHRFEAGQQWTYRLTDLAHYVSLHDDLMAHWDRVLPGRVKVVDYDLLVSEFEPQVRELLAKVGLAFEPACLSPHLTRRRVATSSDAQVREPVNTSSQGRWRHFEPELAGLKRELGLG